jgi:hypothetical protein
MVVRPTRTNGASTSPSVRRARPAHSSEPVGGEIFRWPVPAVRATAKSMGPPGSGRQREVLPQRGHDPSPHHYGAASREGVPATGVRDRHRGPPSWSLKVAYLQGKRCGVRGPLPLGAAMDSSAFLPSREVLPQRGHGLRPLARQPLSSVARPNGRRPEGSTKRITSRRAIERLPRSSARRKTVRA